MFEFLLPINAYGTEYSIGAIPRVRSIVEKLIKHMLYSSRESLRNNRDILILAGPNSTNYCCGLVAGHIASMRLRT